VSGSHQHALKNYNWDPGSDPEARLLDEAINSRGFKRLFPAERLKAYRDSFEELKGNKQVCQTSVGVFQTLLLAGRSDMDHIIEATRKIQAHSAALVKAA